MITAEQAREIRDATASSESVKYWMDSIEKQIRAASERGESEIRNLFYSTGMGSANYYKPPTEIEQGVIIGNLQKLGFKWERRGWSDAAPRESYHVLCW